MKKQINDTCQSLGDIWIISKGQYVEPFLPEFKERNIQGPIVEYKISELARYMLNPNQIEIKKKLIGCKISFKKSKFSRFRDALGRFLPRGLKKFVALETVKQETLFSDAQNNIPVPDDENLASHVKKIKDILRGYDFPITRLSQIDINTISDITGICDDHGGNTSFLRLHGDIEEKRKYIYKFLLKDVGVFIPSAYMAKGLFEMRGFDFQSIDPEKYFRLIKIKDNHGVRYCVIGSNNMIDFWVVDNNLMKSLHIFEQSVQADYRLKRALEQCVAGETRPLKLFFNNQLEINYSKTNIPRAYKQILSNHPIKSEEKNKVVASLLQFQFGIAFNSISKAGAGDKELCTNISVMHNIKALEQIKNDLPWLYSKIEKNVCSSEAGRFYLLDSIKGYHNG